MGTYRRQLNGLLLALLLIHLLWFSASYLLAKPLLPSPVVVYQAFPRLVAQDMGHHLAASLQRVGLGMGCGVFFGSLLGLGMGRWARLNLIFDPLLYLVYPLPKLALLPILMLLFGLGETSKIVLIVLIVLPQVTLSVRDTVKLIPTHYYEVYQGIQATRGQQFVAITLPASLGAIFSAARVSLGTAISVLFFMENYGTKFGMGYFVMDMWMRMDYPLMYGGILLLSAVGFCLFLCLDGLNRLLIPWQV